MIASAKIAEAISDTVATKRRAGGSLSARIDPPRTERSERDQRDPEDRAMKTMPRASHAAILEGRIGADLVRKPAAERSQRNPGPRHEAVADALAVHSRGTQ